MGILSILNLGRSSPPPPPPPSSNPLRINDQVDLELWFERVCSRGQVDRLEWHGINSLKDFYEDLCTLTGVKEAKFTNCKIFSFLQGVAPLRALGPSLVKLHIEKAETSPIIMENLLADLPKINSLFLHALQIESNPNFVGKVPGPFSNNPGKMKLLSMDSSKGKFGWIPPTSRFTELSIQASCAYLNPELVSDWITSSCDTLKVLNLHCDTEYNGVCLDQHNF